MEIVNNRALILRTKDPSKYACIPDSADLGADAHGIHEVAVRWGLDEIRVLRNLGVKEAPSPILGRYDWPGRFKPFAHQKDTSAFLTLYNRAFVFSEPGTGKTLSAIWAADYLMNIGRVRKVVILCPLSIMSAAWQKDIGSSAIHRTAVICHHVDSQRRVRMVERNYDFTIINYDGLPMVLKALQKRDNVDLVIIDEANAYCSTQTKRWKVLNALLTPNMMVWMMTGTPAAQSPVHAYGLAKVVNPSGVPRFQTAWRDMVMRPVTKFKWIPKSTANELVHTALQPAIRFTKKQCLDLPPVLTETREAPLTPQQAKYYKIIKTQMLSHVAGETISAVNAAAVVTKLLQISCIAYNTPVLTDEGWVPIQDVRPSARVWDGVEWQNHGGVVHKGQQRTVECFGVRMTPEHKVLTRGGWWTTAEEVLNGESGHRFNREGIWIPDGAWESWFDSHGSGKLGESDVAVQVHVRPRSDTRKPESSNAAPPQREALWMQARRAYRYAWDVIHAAVQHLASSASTLHRSVRQRLAKLRSTGNHHVRAMGEVLRRFLEGHAGGLFRYAHSWTQQQFERVLQAQLSMGNSRTAMQQHAQECCAEDAQRTANCHASGARIRTEKRHAGAATSTRMAGGTCADGRRDESEENVYDILDCGPRSRFVVRDKEGKPLAVHNCGAAYSDTHEVIEFDCSPRLNVLMEVLEETPNKTLVFAHYRSSIETIRAYLTKHGVVCDVIHGDVSRTKRGEIFHAFQTKDEPRVLVIQEQAAAHGVTLTRADTVVFWGPVMSVEMYIQCIARTDRIGQVSDHVTVVHIQGSDIERKMFAQLEARVTSHIDFVALYKEEAHADIF